MASNRNEYQERFLGGKDGRCLRLTTYHHPVPLSRNLGALTSWNPLGLSRPVLELLYLYYTKILLGDFNAKVGRENIFKPTIGNESLRQDNNDNSVRIVNFAISINLVVKSKIFPHRNIHKYTWTLPDWKTLNQTDHILIERRWQTSILEVLRFWGAHCDTDHYLVFAKVRERLAVSKQAAQKFDGERFNPRKLNELEVIKQYQIEMSNRFAALENLSDNKDINRAWENIKETSKTSATQCLGLHELKQHKPWFDEECLGFLDKRKKATMQWV